MGSWRCLGCSSLTDKLANCCSECSKKLDNILRSSQRVAEAIQPNSPSLFASRVWTECTGEDRRAGAALADVFFFGWLLDQRSSFRAAAALQLISRSLPDTSINYGNLATSLAQEVRLEVGAESFREAYTIVSAFASRHIELCMGIEQALTFSFEALVRLNSLGGGLPYQTVRLMKTLPEARIFDLAEPYWPNWSTNWRLAFENKEISNPIWGLAQHAMISEDAYYFLFLSLLDPKVSFEELKRTYTGLDHWIWSTMDLHKQNTQSKIDRNRFMVSIEYSNWIDRRKWSKDYWFLERALEGREKFRKLQTAETYLLNLADRDYIGKLEQMAKIEDFMRLIEARELAHEIEDHVKAEISRYEAARN